MEEIVVQNKNVKVVNTTLMGENIHTEMRLTEEIEKDCRTAGLKDGVFEGVF